MLRPNPDILKKIQSLTNNPILMAKSDTDLIAILNESRDVAPLKQNAVAGIDLPNSKIVFETTDEATTTRL